jgi:hypothetical protein
VAVDVATLIAWLPNGSEYDTDPESADYALLSECLAAMVDHVGGQCAAVINIDAEDVMTKLSEVDPDAWPRPVQRATIMLAADLYAYRNRPGVLESGTYIPRNAMAERLLGSYLVIGFA